MLFIAYFFILLFVLIDLFLLIKFVEYIYCSHFVRQPPLVQSIAPLRQATTDYIRANYKNAQNICELGSGFGGLARQVARKTRARVYALENMPFSAFLSKVLDIITMSRNRTIWCDAFKYLDDTDVKFDIAIAYLGPDFTNRIYVYRDKIRILISLDFELDGVAPISIIDVGHGYTRYNGKKYPHKLFIYDMAASVRLNTDGTR